MADDPQTQLTPEALARLREELEWRSTTHRREISAWIERAREHGDIRENADYDAAKNEQGYNEGRIRHLETLLETATVVERGPSDVVSTGMVVTIKLAEDVCEYLVGSIEERHEAYDVVSPGSPLGKALMGRGVGEIVDYQAPGGTFKVEILDIKPPS